MRVIDGDPPKRPGAAARRKIQNELREKYVAASAAIPGTKENWVYKARGGQFQSGAILAEQCMKLADAGAPDALVLNLAEVPVISIQAYLEKKRQLKRAA